MLTRCSTVCRTAMPASTATPRRVKNRSPPSGSRTASHQDEQRRLERRSAGGTSARRPPCGPAPARRSAARTASSLTGRQPAAWPAPRPTRSVSALIRIAPSAARVPRNAHSQSVAPGAVHRSAARKPRPTSSGRLAEVVADPVEVDAGDRGLAAPAGQLAVEAVEQQVELHQHGAEHRPVRPGTSSAAPASTPATIIR